jgi:hypothetical protein
MTDRPGRWIPPQGLIFAQLAHGASWIVLFVVALNGRAAGGLPALGWVHLVALGWLTMTALSVLIHVIPAFTDVVWTWERIARAGLALYAAGVVVLVAAFCTGALRLLPWGGTIVALGLLSYAIPAGLTLANALRLGALEAAIARALGITLACLLAAAGLGVAFTWALNGRLPAWLPVAGAPIHADLGLIGWLTLLVMGVSARTIGPIAGQRSRRPWRHIAAVSAQLFGMVALATGSALHSPTILWAGVVVIGLGVAIYATDLAVVLRHATVRHRPPQAFLAAAASWLVVAFVLCVGAMRGLPWWGACVYVALVGWIGQMVNGHLHHIGVRLIATVFRGDDDETRPEELLSPVLSWAAFGLFQTALMLGVAGLLGGASSLLASGAVAGLAGWLMMAANTVRAVRRAMRPPALISLLGAG